MVERLTPTFNLTLDKIEGEDALKIKAQVHASGDVSYYVILDDAGPGFDQHKQAAQLTPRVRMSNGTSVDFENMSVELPLNQPPGSVSWRGVSAERADGIEISASRLQAALEVQEGGSGALNMPIRSGDVTLRTGETKVLNFASAVNGTPNATMEFVPITIDQKLVLTTFVARDKKEGVAHESSASPMVTLTLAATAESRPAGIYEVFEEGSPVASPFRPSESTAKGETLDIPGVALTAIKGRSSFETVKFTEGNWTNYSQGSSRRDRQKAVHSYDMKYHALGREHE